MAQQLTDFAERCGQLRSEIGKVIVGQEEVVDGVIIGLLADGHVLLEGIPGLGKTRLVRTLAEALHVEFSRIQFTPDLMPADIVGTHVLREDETGGRRLVFEPGPIFANLVLADEINRATPKTQSALLEAMQETTVTVGGETNPLGPPFFVLATQNPLEMEGTYPLPEAQLDRFLFKLRMSYPGTDELHTILDRTTSGHTPTAAVLWTAEQVIAMRRAARLAPIAHPVQEYAIRIGLATRPEGDRPAEAVRRYVRIGASPRGVQAMVLGAKVHALIRGRVHVAREDIRAVALPALRHRVLLNFEGEAERIDLDDLLQDLVDNVPEG
ncbi:MAG: MoxR family ATPase [Acidobacteria bacterium]|nr:MoxR family ATPase [Acidobacteriota bacterium]